MDEVSDKEAGAQYWFAAWIEAKPTDHVLMMRVYESLGMTPL